MGVALGGCGGCGGGAVPEPGPARADASAAAVAAVADPLAPWLDARTLPAACDAELGPAARSVDALRHVRVDGGAAPSFDDSLGRLEYAIARARRAVQVGGYLRLLGVEPRLAAAAEACAGRGGSVEDAAWSDSHTARVLDAYRASDEGLSAERRWALDGARRELEGRGAALDPRARARIGAIDAELTRLKTAFDDNLRATAEIAVPRAALDGLPDDYVRAHAPTEGGALVTLTTAPSDSTPFINLARDRGAARELYFARDRQLAANVPLLERVLALRSEKAGLLGRATWADLRMAGRLAAGPAAVRDFLDRIADAIRPNAERELAALSGEQAALGGAPGAPVADFDEKYLEGRLEARRGSSADLDVRDYVELSDVLAAAFRIYDELFDVRVREVHVRTWHPSVRVLDLFDASGVLGRVYLDLEDRPGKRPSTESMPLGAWKIAAEAPAREVTLVIANLAKSSDQRTHLSADEVRDVFHELGHVLQGALPRCELPALADNAAPRDFVEVPSQLFERWATEPAVVAMYARDARGGAAPDAILERLARRRDRGALARQQQVAIAKLDLAYHTAPPGFDSADLLDRVWRADVLLAREPGTHAQGRLYPLVTTGYDAGYYAYQWSDAWVVDAWTRFEAAGPLDRGTAQALRREVLERGACEDPREAMTRFLSRPPSDEAFLAELRRPR
ncbi:MAG TPA: M3 family metallopeptidase [Byssovorax sp.]